LRSLLEESVQGLIVLCFRTVITNHMQLAS
jgi:hypothetical protein